MQPGSVNAKRTSLESVVISVKPIILIWTLKTTKDVKLAFVTDTVSVVHMRKVSELRLSNLVLILILMDGVFKINMVSVYNTW